jgi:hypothetical protein
LAQHVAEDLETGERESGADAYGASTDVGTQTGELHKLEISVGSGQFESCQVHQPLKIENYKYNITS